MVGNTLRETVQWMEGVTCEWGRHDPLVMRLVQRLVDSRVMQAPMNPVNEHIGERNKERELQDIIKSERGR